MQENVHIPSGSWMSTSHLRSLRAVQVKLFMMKEMTLLQGYSRLLLLPLPVIIPSMLC